VIQQEAQGGDGVIQQETVMQVAQGVLDHIKSLTDGTHPHQKLSFGQLLSMYGLGKKPHPEGVEGAAVGL